MKPWSPVMLGFKSRGTVRQESDHRLMYFVSMVSATQYLRRVCASPGKIQNRHVQREKCVVLRPDKAESNDKNDRAGRGGRHTEE